MNMSLKGMMKSLNVKPGQVVSNPYAKAFAPQIDEAKKVDVNQLKKGDKIKINMGGGKEEVEVMGDMKAGVSKTAFITLKRKTGAPYTITLSKLEKILTEAEGQDHEVHMAQSSLDSIIKNATELKGKIGENEKDIPAWIQDHITNSENYIEQANSGYHEYNESVNEEQINEWKLQLDLGKVNPSNFENWASDSLQKKHKIKVSGYGKNWTIVGKGNDDRMGSSSDWISQLLGKAWGIDKIKVVQKESVNEAKYYIGYNKGRGQGKGILKDKSFSNYKDAKKEVEKIEKMMGGTINQTAYYVANEKGDLVSESVNEVIMLDKNMKAEIEQSIDMGFDTLNVGMISAKRKGVMLTNKKYEVRGVYPIEYKSVIQSIIDSKKK